jgi:hypothetical protein
MTERLSPSGIFQAGTIQAGRQETTAAPVAIPNPGGGLVFGGAAFTTSQANQALVAEFSADGSNAVPGGGAAYQMEVDGVPVAPLRTRTSTAPGEVNSIAQSARIVVAVVGSHVLNVRATTFGGPETVANGATQAIYADQ